MEQPRDSSTNCWSVTFKYILKSPVCAQIRVSVTDKRLNGAAQMAVQQELLTIRDPAASLIELPKRTALP